MARLRILSDDDFDKLYKIPLLSITKPIITCLKWMRLDMPQYINNPATFHSNCSKELSLRVKKRWCNTLSVLSF